MLDHIGIIPLSNHYSNEVFIYIYIYIWVNCYIYIYIYHLGKLKQFTNLKCWTILG